MRHLLPDPKAQEEFGDYFTVLSCEFDNGKRVTTPRNIVRLGEDGKVMLLLGNNILDT